MRSVSPGTRPIRSASQSAAACAMRSLREDTKFHQMWRGPSGAPPTSITRAAPPAARSVAVLPAGGTASVKGSTRSTAPSISTSNGASTPYSARSSASAGVGSASTAPDASA